MTNPASISFRVFFFAALLLLVTLAFASPRLTSAGGPLVVNKTADTADGTCDETDCSLREAVISANASPRDISVPAGTYNMSLDDPLEENDAALGDLDVKAAYKIVGAGADTTIIDGGGLSRVFHLAAPVSVNISGVTIRNGAGIYGAGIYVAAGTLTLENSTVSGNVTNTSNGGGGIFSQATLVVNNSTISGNTATGAYGGGIYAFSAGTVTVTNSTISGNTALFGGGGVDINTPVVATLTNVTVSDNTSTTANSGGGIRKGGQGGAINLKNTIVAGNTTGGNCAGVITSNGNNLEDGTSCGLNGSGDLNDDPGLAALTLNVPGKTETHALLPDSPAVDGGAGCPPPATDQRGVARPLGTACDIGAYESDSRGDTNCDGKVDSFDVIDVLNDVGDVGTTAECLENGDVDGDGQITIMDAFLILEYMAGVITTFPTNNT